ncbi:MAG TPA: hydrogenase maturation protease [Acidimicrobiales bacterium]|nr:hydrogenase maturation protease [Acidimicrobiales bacterium]
MTARIVVAGIGNDVRRDDGAGTAVVRDVAARLGSHVAGTLTCVAPLGEPLDLLGVWDHCELAVVVDATRSGAAPGSIRLLELGHHDGGADPAGADPAGVEAGGVETGGVEAAGVEVGGVEVGGVEVVSTGMRSPPSTHGLGIAAVFRLARAVGRAPRRVVVVGIEGGDFGIGEGLTVPVRRSVSEAVEAVMSLVGEVAPCA